MNKKSSNQLIHETSPYLLQHAHNPVAWHPWSKQTIAKAKAENKLLLISIGYSTCHWCHVMERESFEDIQVAELMNRHFICVKVDREERPDVDQVFMDAVQIMTGRGGWPLNCFALPDGRPVYGGTYFPKSQWIDILQQLADLYQQDPDKVASHAQELMRGLVTSDQITPNRENHIQSSLIDLITTQLHQEIDPEKGGTRGAPKFPLPSVLFSELHSGYSLSDDHLRKHVDLTLTKMARGGIYDQIGGGFARYSVDDSWKVPHFEKMLYDNAQLINLYSTAHKHHPNKEFQKTVEDTFTFLSRELKETSGGLYSALDADSEGEEGRFYVWNASEFKTQLGEYGALISRYFGVGKEGFWEHGKNILVRTKSNAAFAQEENLSETELEALLKMAGARLLQHRNKRIRPSLDDKIITSWNALAVDGLLAAYEAFADKKYLEQALQTATLIKDKLIQKDHRILHLLPKGNKRIGGFLDDYAFTAQAFLRLYSNTQNPIWINLTKGLIEYAMEHFYDPKSNLFYYSTESELLHRKKDIFDNVIPSANSAMMHVLFDLSRILERPDYEEISRKALLRVSMKIKESAVAFSGWAQLAMKLYFPYYTFVITGSHSRNLIMDLQKLYLPNVLILGAETPSEFPVFKDRFSSTETRIFVCDDNTCYEPVNHIEEALKILKK